MVYLMLVQMDYIFDNYEEIEPETMVESDCGWNTNTVRRLLDLSEKCSLKKSKRPNIGEVLKTLEAIRNDYIEQQTIE